MRILFFKDQNLFFDNALKFLNMGNKYSLLTDLKKKG